MPDPAPAAAPAAPGEPKSLLDKIGAALPVGLTALATIFAGMSTGQLQQAMYWKSQAAQDQAKAADQWGLATAKRDRALMMENTARLIRLLGGAGTGGGTVPPGPTAREAEKTAAAWLSDRKAGPPAIPMPAVTDAALAELLKALKAEKPEDRRTEAEVLHLAGRVRLDEVNKALDAAEAEIRRADAEWKPILDAAGDIVRDAGAAATRAKPGERERLEAHAKAVEALGCDLQERRYRAESRANQEIGFLYEARVKVTTAESDKHRQKSETLFKAMLVAQVGAVASSLALARKRRSLLWLFAAAVGLVAVGFGAYAVLPGLPLIPSLG